MVCGLSAIQLIPMDPQTAEGWGMLLGSWGGLMILGAGVVGIVMSLIHWSEWPLRLCSALCLSEVAVFIAEEENVVGGWAAMIYYVASSIAIALFCIRWFAFARKRGTPSPKTSSV
jgi:hypothetical protein